MKCRYIKHLLLFICIKLPLTLVGALILLPVTYKYSLGDFPRWCKWLDDYRARRLVEISKLDRNRYCASNFGTGHCMLFYTYNSTWKGRYIWSAWRNQTNYFNHAILGIKTWSATAVFLHHSKYSKELVEEEYVPGLYSWNYDVYAWEYSRYNGNEIKIPLIPLYIRIRMGYKLSDLVHVQHMALIGFPLEYAFSIGLRIKI